MRVVWPGRHHHGGSVGGLADHLDAVGVLELPAPLEGVDVDDGARVGLDRGDLVLHHHRGPEEPEHDQDRHDRVDDLGERVVLRLHRHVVGAAPVAEDGPADEQEREAADDDAGDEEALPEVEGGAGLRGGALVGAERRELAAGEEQGAQTDHHDGQPAAWILGAATWGFGCVGRRAGQRRVHRADTIEPGKKIGNRRGQCGWAWGGAADSLAAQVKTPRAMVEVARAARAAKTCWRARCTASSSGRASQACSARWPARRNAPSAAAASDFGHGQQLQGPLGQGAGPAGQRSQLGGQGALGRRLQRGRVAVPPAAVLAPHRVDDELGLVVDRLGGRAGPPGRRGRARRGWRHRGARPRS